MAHSFRPYFAILAAVLFLVPCSSAFQSPLSDEDIRDAYFLGQRHDESTANLLFACIKTLPPPTSRPHVSELEIYTPSSQLVERSRAHSVGYSGQQAKQPYRATSARILVRS